jgi:hypothetical protein
MTESTTLKREGDRSSQPPCTHRCHLLFPLPRRQRRCSTLTNTDTPSQRSNVTWQGHGKYRKWFRLKLHSPTRFCCERQAIFRRSRSCWRFFDALERTVTQGIAGGTLTDIVADRSRNCLKVENFPKKTILDEFSNAYNFMMHAPFQVKKWSVSAEEKWYVSAEGWKTRKYQLYDKNIECVVETSLCWHIYRFDIRI